MTRLEEHLLDGLIDRVLRRYLELEDLVWCEHDLIIAAARERGGGPIALATTAALVRKHFSIAWHRLGQEWHRARTSLVDPDQSCALCNPPRAPRSTVVALTRR